MKTKLLKNMLLILVVITIAGIISINADGQIIDPINYEFGYYYPVWSLIGIGAPWWATTVSEQPIQPLGFQWPRAMLPFSACLGGCGITGFAGIGFSSIQPTTIPAYQGFPEMSNVPPGFGLSLGLGMGAFGGLGVNHFGSPDAITTMGVPWNWQPFFGMTSISPGYFYLGMFSPWWSTQQPLTYL